MLIIHWNHYRVGFLIWIKELINWRIGHIKGSLMYFGSQDSHSQLVLLLLCNNKHQESLVFLLINLHGNSHSKKWTQLSPFQLSKELISMVYFYKELNGIVIRIVSHNHNQWSYITRCQLFKSNQYHIKANKKEEKVKTSINVQHICIQFEQE